MALLVVSLGAWFVHRPSAATLAERTRRAVVVVDATVPDGEVFGSGFFVRDDVIVTNFHVIKDAQSVNIQLFGGRVFKNIPIIRTDPSHDLALLLVNQPGVSLQLRSDDNIQQGDVVYALGNPKGLSFTFSAGLVSSRRQHDGTQLIQITAPISHGSSGGPVIDDEGRVVGVSTSMLTDGQNLNFAVDALHVRDLLSEPVIRAGIHSDTVTRSTTPASSFDTGFYLVTFKFRRADSLALFIHRADDSLSAEAGKVGSKSPPEIAMSGPLRNRFPATFDYGRPELQFTIDSVISQRLFAGHFTFYNSGAATAIPFTAARR